MFEAVLDEQLIMHRTGNSTSGVRSYTVRVKKSVHKVSNRREITFEVLHSVRECILCSARVLLLEVHDRAAKRISATRKTYQRFCRPTSPLSLYLIASLNSSSFSLASLLYADRSIGYTIIRNIAIILDRMQGIVGRA